MKICLCGSTKFRNEYEAANKQLTLEGHVVLSVAGFGHAGDTFTEGEKELLDLIHLQKILFCDAIYVIDVGGYIGDSTRREIKWAELNGKMIVCMSKEKTREHGDYLRNLFKEKFQ